MKHACENTRWRWIAGAAGCWCLAGAAELVGQWRLLAPPFASFFGGPEVAGVMAVYLLFGLACGALIGTVRSSAARWGLLLIPPTFVAVGGLLFPAGGLISPSGALACAVVLALGGAGACMLSGRTPSRLLALPVLLVASPLVVPTVRSPTPRAAQAKSTRPNVVLVTLDTLRPDHLGLAGYPRPTSPGLDSLAAEGVVFTQAYAPAPSTSPAHATLFTGLSPSVHGVRRNGWPLPRGVPTLAEALSDAGYATGAVVSVAHLAGAFGWDRGFAFFHDQGSFDRLFPYSGARLIRLPLRFLPQDFSCRAEVSVTRALAWLERVDEPFFLWLHLWDPHDPYEPPPPYDRMFTGSHPRPEGCGYTAEEVSRWVNGYDGEIRYVDDQLQRLWRFLRARGLANRTVVAVASDHGESLGERSYRGHSILLYDEQVRVLLLLTGPGIEPARVETPVGLVDVASTLLAATSLPREWPSEGRSLLDSLPMRPVRFEVDMWGFVGRGVRLGKWKLSTYDRINPDHRGFASRAHARGPGARTELFDMASDPGETTNGAGERPDLVADLAALCDQPGAPGDVTLPPGLHDALRALGYLQ